MGWIALGVMAVQAVVSAKGQMDAGDAAKEEANTRAGQLLVDADNTRDAALGQAEKIRAQGKTTAGAARAAYAASGVDVGSASANDARQAIIANSESDAWSQILTGNREANSLQNNAAATVKAGSNAKSASNTAAFGSVLNGVGKVAGGVSGGSGWQSAAQSSANSSSYTDASARGSY